MMSSPKACMLQQGMAIVENVCSVDVWHLVVFQEGRRNAGILSLS